MHRAIKSALMFRHDILKKEKQRAVAVLVDPDAPATLRQQAENTISMHQARDVRTKGGGE